MSLNPLTYQPHSNFQQGASFLQEFSCNSSCSFVIGQFRWTSSRTHLLGWNVWQKPKYKFSMIMLITQVSTLLRWDVKWFNFCQPTSHCRTNNVRQFDPSLNVLGSMQLPVTGTATCYMVTAPSISLNYNYFRIRKMDCLKILVLPQTHTSRASGIIPKQIILASPNVLY